MIINFIFKELLSCILRVPVSQMTFKVSLPLYVVDNFTFSEPYLHKVHSTEQKEMATHSSIQAWRIPRTAEPGGLQSMGSQRVGHD